MTAWQSAELDFADDHPTASGHFPGNPIIPGALLLDEVVATIAGDDYDGAVMIRAAKFLKTIRPGERINLRWQTLGSGALKFECRMNDQDGPIVTGTLEFGPLSP
jgi:3-hydroxyacyl-[acyl-carrier-protein] dehydratase